MVAEAGSDEDIAEEDDEHGNFVGIDVLSDGSSLITCTTDGNARLTPNASSTTASSFAVGSPVSKMRLAPDVKSVIGLGGKEKGLEIWQLDTQQTVFKAKNVKQDFLDLRVPVWLTDLCFFPSSPENTPRVVTGTAYSQVRLYDCKAQRRPVHTLELEEPGEGYAVTCVCLTPDEQQVLVGDTTGMLSCWDLRTWKRLGRLMGPHGAIGTRVAQTRSNTDFLCGICLCLCLSLSLSLSNFFSLRGSFVPPHFAIRCGGQSG